MVGVRTFIEARNLREDAKGKLLVKRLYYRFILLVKMAAFLALLKTYFLLFSKIGST